jgi:hypothetical protein
VAGEARKEERRWEAMWSYRANPPMVEFNGHKVVVELNAFMAQLGLAEATEPNVPEITDEEIERLMRAGRMGWIPPGG